MKSQQELEQLFTANRPAIEAIVTALCRRNGLAEDDAGDFAGWVWVRFVETDYAVLAKFRGESSLTTYLTTVLAMWLKEYRVHLRGRWRPSAAAKRDGPLAVRLETLTQRDGLTLMEAAERLRTAGETSLADRDLAAIASRLPRRTPLRPVVAGEADAPARDRADDVVDAEERARESEVLKRELDSALSELPPQDALVVKLHYMQGLSVADVARGLAVRQKPLYRQIERTLGRLRSRLERAGVSRERIALLAHDPP